MASPIQLLLVEPDDANRRRIHRALRGRATRFRITDAPSLQDVSQRLRGARYDIALVDLDGWPRPFDGLDHLLRSAPDLPVAVLSRNNHAAEAIRRGACRFVAKTEQDLALLHSTLAAVVEQAKERTRTQAQLKQLQLSDARYRLLLDHVAEALLLCGSAGDILHVNHAAEKLLDRPAQALIGAPFARLLSGHSPSALRDWAGSHPVRVVLHKPTIPVEVRVTPLAFEDSSVFLVKLRDLQREERSERLLQALSRASAAMQGALTPQDVLRAAGEQLRSIGLILSVFRYLDDEHAVVMIHTELGRRVLSQARRMLGFDPMAYQARVDSSPVLQSILSRDSPVVLSDANQVVRELLPRRLKRLADPLAKLLNYEEQFGLRLTLAGETYGLIMVGYPHGHLVPEDQPIIEAFAVQIQAALERSQRFEVTQSRLADQLQQLTRLVRVGEQMQLRQPLDRLLDAICGAIWESLKWGQVIVWLSEARSATMSPVAVRGVSPKSAAWPGGLDEKIWRRSEYRVGRCYLVAGGDPGAQAWQPGDMLVAPIEIGGALLGAIQLDRPQSGLRPAPDDLTPLDLFANQAAVAIENAQLYVQAGDRLKRRVDNLTSLTTLSAVVDQGDLRASLEQALYQVLRVSGMDAIDISLLDSATGELRPYVWRGLSDAFWEEVKTSPMRIGEGVGGRALAAGSAIVVTEVPTDPRVPYRDSLVREGVETVVGIGLAGRAPVGAMTLYAYEARQLGDETLDWLTVAGRQIALSIENNRLIDATRRRQRMAEAVREVNAAVASNLELDSVLATILDQASRVVPHSSSCIMLAESNTLRVIAVRGLVDPGNVIGRAFPRDDRNPAWQAVVSREAQLVTDIRAADGRSNGVLDGSAQSWIGAPLIVRDEVIGLLALHHHQAGFYTQEDARNASLIAQQAAVAIDNARRFEIEHARSERLRLLNDLGRELVVALDRDTIVRQAVKQIAGRFGYRHVAVWWLDPALNELAPIARSDERRHEQEAQSMAHLAVGRGIVGQAAATRQTYVTGDVDADPYYVVDPSTTLRVGPADASTRSEIGVPLRIEERIVGVLDIQSDRSNAFSADDVIILETAASQIGAALAIAELYQETQARAGNLSLLFAASQELGSSLDSDQVFGRLAQWIVTAVEATSARVYVWDLQTNVGRLLAQYVGARASAGERQSRVGVEQDLGGLSILVTAMKEHRWTVYETTTDHDAIDAALREVLRAGVVHSALYLPLVVRERPIGYVEIWETGRIRSWTPDEAYVCQTIANVAASAIDNARLFEVERQRRKVAETVRELAAVISSSLEPQAILESLLDRAAELIPYDSAAVFIAPGELSATGAELSGQLRIAVSRGMPAEAHDSPPGLAEEVLRTRRVSICADAREGGERGAAHGPSALPPSEVASLPLALLGVGDFAGQALDHVRGWLGAPLVVKGSAIGVLTFDSRTPARYRREHAEIAETIANHAAVAIENAQLYQEARQRVAELETLQAVSLEMIQSLDARRVSQAIADGALRLLSATVVHLFSFDAETDKVELVAFSTAPGFKEVGRPTPRREGMTMRIAHSGQAVVINDPQNDPAFGPITRATAEQGAKALVGLPLKVREKVLGVMNVLFHAPHIVVDNEVRILGLLADQAATALENARLFEGEQKRRVAADVLREISGVLTSTLNLGELCERLFDQIARVIPYASAAVTLVEASRHLRIIAGRGFQQPAQIIGRTLAPGDASLSGRVIDAREPLVVEDVQQLGNWEVLPGMERAHGWMGAPLIARDQVIGTLSVDHEQAGIYRREQAELLGVIANQAAAAITNARLYEQALERERFASALGRTSLAIMSSLELDEVLEQICRESSGAFNVDSGLVWLAEGDDLVGFAGHGPAREGFVGVHVGLGDASILGARVLAERRGEYINYAETDPRDNRELIHRMGLKSLLGVPMVQDDAPIGTLVVGDSVRPDPFSAADIERAQVLASHAVIAIENARLFQAEQRRARQLALVNRVGLDITSILDLDQLAQTVVEEIRGAFGYYHVSVVTIHGGELVWRAGAGGDVEGWTPAGMRRPVGVGIIGAVAATGEMLVAPDVRRDPRYVSSPEVQRTLSEVALPLKAKGSIVGVLNVESDYASAFGEEDLAVLTALASQLGVAVENAMYATSLETRVAERTAEIRREQERTFTILNSVADAVLVTDLAGAIVLTNPVADALLREDQEAEQPDRLHTWLRELSPASGSPKIDAGGRTLQAAVAYIREEDRRVGHVIVLRDITRLEEVDRLKTQFVTTVSHELRTPLTNIKLYLGLFQKGKPEKREQYLVTLQNEVNRLERLIMDLLDLARLERDRQMVTRNVIDLAEVLQHVVSTLEPQAEAKRQSLHLRLTEQALYVPADRNQMIQVFVNLCANAINYTPPDGRVELEASTMLRDGRNWAVVSVSDNGIGIPEEDRERVFDRFYRGQAEHFEVRGTGLGLSIVKEIVVQHSGQIELESRVGLGSTFTVWLPMN